MAVFEPDRPVTTAEPRVVVDAGLPPGRHRFRLVVVNDRGIPSEPDEAVVTVVRTTTPPPPPIPAPTPGGGVIR